MDIDDIKRRFAEADLQFRALRDRGTGTPEVRADHQIRRRAVARAFAAWVLSLPAGTRLTVRDDAIRPLRHVGITDKTHAVQLTTASDLEGWAEVGAYMEELGRATPSPRLDPGPVLGGYNAPAGPVGG